MHDSTTKTKYLYRFDRIPLGMKDKKFFRALFFGFGLIGIVFLTGFQLQNLIWSTARLSNDSTQPISEVRILIDDTIVPIGNLSVAESRLLRLPNRGDATFIIQFKAHGREYTGCNDYVEGEMYHVRVSISPAFEISCSVELAPLHRLMILELM